MIENTCALVKLKSLKDNSQDFIFGDPPYALGSTVYIDKDGKPKYKIAKDFMSKWEMPDHTYWEEFFKVAEQKLKFGGRILFFGIDRQLFLFQYYGVAAGFEIKQSLYWYFISNFPKATDLSKQIDKRGGSSLKWFIDYLLEYITENKTSKKDLTALFPSKNGNQTGWLWNISNGNSSITVDQYNKIKEFLNLPFNTLEEAERNIVGLKKAGGGGLSGEDKNGSSFKRNKNDTVDVTESNTELGKKYEGYKYSISPLKQVLETVMVFQKRTKNKSILDDVFAFENGDETISPSIWAIDEGRVPTSKEITNHSRGEESSISKGKYGDSKAQETHQTDGQKIGRYPSQMFIDSTCASKIDEQSGEQVSSDCIRKNTNKNNVCYGKYEQVEVKGHKDSGGASRILHNIGYLDEELDLVFYSPKVSTFEREHGCGDIERKNNMRVNAPRENEEAKTSSVSGNSHPTLKPIKLIYQIAKLLKAPFPQNVFFPFSGAGSEIIGFEQAGFDRTLFEMSELDEDFCNIAETRRKAWRDMDINNLDKNREHLDKMSIEHKNQGSLF